MRRRSVALLVASLTAVTLAAACGGGGDDGESETQQTDEPEAPPIAPLTGLPDPDGAAAGRPALSVKVENHPDARPQQGLEAADVVYEEVVEGEITRFLAVFNSAVPETVGPIRSVRLTDPDIVWPLGGVFAYSGGATPSVEAISQAPVNAIDESAAGDAMFRDNPRGVDVEHTLYGRGQALIDKGGEPVPPPALFTYYAEGEATVGEPVASTRIGFIPGYDPTYTYDAASRTWLRSYGFEPFTVGAGVQIAPTNVVVQFTDYVGGAGNPTAEGQSVGEGDVWVFTDGKVVRGRWTRPAVEQPAQYVDAAGAPIKLLPGRTWVHLLPIGEAVDVTPGAPAPAVTTTTG